MKYVIYSDGGARNNPGPGACGFLIYHKNNAEPIFKGNKFLGDTTNNQAEYQGVIEALKKLYELDNNPEDIEVFLDSKLIVEQMNGNYKVKDEKLKPLFWEIRDLIVALKVVIKFIHIPREKNKEADLLVNKAIDEKK